MSPRIRDAESQTWAPEQDFRCNQRRNKRETPGKASRGVQRIPRMARTLDDLLFDTKDFAFDTGVNFRGLTISENGAGFNIVIRAFDTNGNAVYAMSQHEDPHEGLKLLLCVLATPKGSHLWRRDKYYGNHG